MDSKATSRSGVFLNENYKNLIYGLGPQVNKTKTDGCIIPFLNPVWTCHMTSEGFIIT